MAQRLSHPGHGARPVPPGLLPTERPRRVHERRIRPDVQHLLAHVMAGHDIFVTTDEDDILRRAQALERLGVIALSPEGALERVRASHM